MLSGIAFMCRQVHISAMATPSQVITSAWTIQGAVLLVSHEHAQPPQCLHRALVYWLADMMSWLHA